MIISKFSYGSHVYGCHNQNSDYDYIIVVDSLNEHQFDDDYTTYTEDQFIEQINNHEISVLECLFLPENLFEGKNYEFVLNKPKLRESISQKSSNSFVKAKKKIIDGEFYIAQKSLFHSLRIIQFGIQIAKTGKIYDYSASNHFLYDILNLPVDWNIWKAKYKVIHNNMMSEFRLLAHKL